MTIIAWPTDIKTGPVDYGVEFDVQMSVYRNGRITTFGLAGARWAASIRFEPDLETLMRPKVEALLMSVEGGANQLQMPHWGRPIPNGSLRGTPTVGTAIAAGAKVITIAGASTGTLKRGDIIGVLGQLVMVLADVNPAAGNLNNVPVSPAFRQAINSGTAVVWNKPTALWIPKSNALSFPYAQNRVRPAFSIELVEVF